MPPPASRPGGRFRRVLAAALLILFLAAGYACLHVGQWLSPEQPLRQADAIFVLAGTVAERPLEAVDLYEAGYASQIVITRDTPDAAVIVANRRGAAIPGRDELNRNLLLRLGVPATAVVMPGRVHDSTAEEAGTLREVALARGWKRVIVVSSKYHLRRVALACRRQLDGTGVELVLHATRYDPSTPARWWTRRADIRWVVSELPKVLAYALHVGA